MKRVVLYSIVFIIVTLFGFWSYLQTTHAQKLVLSMIADAVKKNAGHDVEINALSFSLPFKWIAYNVQLKEKDQPWITIGEVEISFSLQALLNQSLNFRKVFFTDVYVADLPQNKSSNSVINWDDLWENLPYPIRISEIQIKNLAIDEKLLPNEYIARLTPLDLTGSLTFDPHLHLINIDLAAGQQSKGSQIATHLHFACQDIQQFLYQFQILETKQGLISHAMNFALPHDFSLALEGKKSQDNSYEGQFHIDLAHEETPPEQKKIDGKFFYSRNGQLNIHSTEGKVGAISLKGEILLNTGDFKIQESTFKLNILNLAFLKNHLKWPVEGSAEAVATLSGTIFEPAINIAITGDQLKIYDELVNHLHGDCTLVKFAEGLKGQALLSFDYRDIGFKSKNEFAWDDQRATIDAIQTTYGNAQFNGHMNYLFDTEIWEGQLQAFDPNSSVLKGLLDFDLHGSTDVSLKFYGSESFHSKIHSQNLDFKIQTDQARYDTFNVEKAILSGIIRDIYHQPTVDMILNAKHIFYNGWKLQDFTAQTSLNSEERFWPFRISSIASSENGLSMESKGRWRLTPQEMNVHFENLHGKIKEHRFNLQDPVTLTIQKDIFDLSPVFLNIGKGTFYIAVDYRYDQAHATTRLNHIPMEIFYPPNFIVPFRGILSGEANLFGAPGELTGQMQLHLSHIKILDEAFKHAPPFEVMLSGVIEQFQTACSAQIVGVTQKPIEIKAVLPISASLNPPTIHVDELAPLAVHVFAQGEIAPLLQLLVIETSSLSGKTSVALDITGSFRDPHISGNITLKNGTFESPNTGAVFHNLNARLEAQDKMLVLKEFKALDLSDGLIQGNGFLELKRDQGFPFNLNLKVTRIRLLNLDFVKAIASGEAVVTGNARGGKVKGKFITDSVQATVPEQVPALAHSLDIKYINLPKGHVSPVFTHSRPHWPLELDVQIDVQNNATISAKNLSTFWHGGLKVEGLAHEPQLFGDFKIIKGEYNFNGKKFEIKEGTITFAGDPEKKTTLYVIASKDLGKINAEVILKGSVRNPSVAFRSNPPLSQREILSWILFGRGATDITPFQGAELSQSINDLAKKAQNEPDMLTKLRDKIGIDRIDISKTEGNESNEVSLQVGKYISRGVFVKLNKSITSQANQVGIEADILPNIKAEAQVGDDSSTMLQLKWKKDY